MTARDLLDAYAAEQVHLTRTVSPEAVAPKAFTALRVVLDVCDRWRFPNGGEHPMGVDIRTAITRELEAS